jgi:hypothetical protein
MERRRTRRRIRRRTRRRTRKINNNEQTVEINKLLSDGSNHKPRRDAVGRLNTYCTGETTDLKRF